MKTTLPADVSGWIFKTGFWGAVGSLVLELMTGIAFLLQEIMNAITNMIEIIFSIVF